MLRYQYGTFKFVWGVKHLCIIFYILKYLLYTYYYLSLYFNYFPSLCSLKNYFFKSLCQSMIYCALLLMDIVILFPTSYYQYLILNVILKASLPLYFTNRQTEIVLLWLFLIQILLSLALAFKGFALRVVIWVELEKKIGWTVLLP